MLNGTLDTFSVGEILELVGASRASGALRVRTDVDEGWVQCHEGAVTFATVGRDNDLGSVLVRGGFVPEVEWSTIANDPEPTDRLADVLGRTDVDADRLRRYLTVQTEESVFELDCWRAGDLHLEADGDISIASMFRYPTSSLLESLETRRGAWAGLLETLGSPDRIVHQAPMHADDDREMRVSRSQLSLLSRVDGDRSIRELAREFGTGLFQTCKVVASLLDCGLVLLSADRVVPTPDRPAVDTRAPSAPTREPDQPSDVPPAPSGGATGGFGGAEFVEPGDGPARDLIVRLLSAVKEEL